jgi:hypothetical protein
MLFSVHFLTNENGTQTNILDVSLDQEHSAILSLVSTFCVSCFFSIINELNLLMAWIEDVLLEEKWCG